MGRSVPDRAAGWQDPRAGPSGGGWGGGGGEERGGQDWVLVLVKRRGGRRARGRVPRPGGGRPGWRGTPGRDRRRAGRVRRRPYCGIAAAQAIGVRSREL